MNQVELDELITLVAQARAEERVAWVEEEEAHKKYVRAHERHQEAVAALHREIKGRVDALDPIEQDYEAAEELAQP